MPLFQRRAPRPAEPWAPFWAWWEDSGRRRTTEALDRGDAADLVPELGRAVEGVHPALSWELNAGDVSEHVLVVTAAGDPALRATARRWLLAAPPGDATWSYTDARPPVADPAGVLLHLEGGVPLGLADVRVTARKAGPRFDVAVHHPAFADLGEEDRLRVTFLALDAALGEDAVELWLGAVTASPYGLVDGFGLAALRSVVEDLREAHLDVDGHPTWALLQGEGPDGPVLATAQVPLHPWTAPHLTTYAGVLLPFTDRTPEGLPGDTALHALRGFEDRLAADLGHDGRVVAHQTSAGTRALHVYVDPETRAGDTVRDAARAWHDGRARVQAHDDPAWQAVAHLRG